jgi:hypothetical protein
MGLVQSPLPCKHSGGLFSLFSLLVGVLYFHLQCAEGFKSRDTGG